MVRQRPFTGLLWTGLPEAHSLWEALALEIFETLKSQIGRAKWVNLMVEPIEPRTERWNIPETRLIDSDLVKRWARDSIDDEDMHSSRQRCRTIFALGTPARSGCLLLL